MLLRLILENFLSFDEPQEFNMFPNLKLGYLENHIYANEKIPLLKQAAIYGNNASGKSNFIKGIDVLRSFVLEEKFLTKRLIEQYRFRLTDKDEDRPIELLIEFENEGQYFIYDLAFSVNGVEREDLYLSGLGKEDNRPIFQRRFDQVEFGETLTASQELQQNTKEIMALMLRKDYQYASLLSLLNRFPVYTSHDIDQARAWFANRLVVLGLGSVMPRLITLLYKDQGELDFINKVFQKITIGVDGVSVRDSDPQKWLQERAEELKLDDEAKAAEGVEINSYIASRPDYTYYKEDGKEKILELVFKQLGKGGEQYSLGVQDQSDGTVRLLMLLPAIHDAISQKKTVVIDEINHCLHPRLLFDLIRFYSQTETHGQLIFTSHELELMEQDKNREGEEQGKIVRPDELWFVDKSEGRSYLSSLSEFKLHHTLSVRRAYREGRFGGSYTGRIININMEKE